jgi:hypothetical protein
VLAGLEAGWRAARGAAPGVAASRLDSLVLLFLGVTIAAGLGLLVGGARPAELLHFVYAVVAIGVMPVAASFTASWVPRRRAIATLVAALIALVVILRLFATG